MTSHPRSPRTFPRSLGLLGLILSVPLLHAADDAPAEPAIEPGPAPTGEAWQRHAIDPQRAPVSEADGVYLADANGDGRLDCVTPWEEGALTRLYLHPGPDAVREPWPSIDLGPTPKAEGALLMDVDGDGAVDVISMSEGLQEQIHVFWGPTEEEHYADARHWQGATVPTLDIVDRRSGEWVTGMAMELDGTPGPELVTANRRFGAPLGWWDVPAEAPRDLADWQFHALHLRDRKEGGIASSWWPMSLRAQDMDGDGDEDVLISERYHGFYGSYDNGVQWHENPGPQSPALREEWVKHPVDVGVQAMFLDYGDIDGDGAEDIIVGDERWVTEHPRLILYRRQDATGTNWQRTDLPFPAGVGTPAGVAIGDIDGDGHPDIVCSCERSEGLIGVFAFIGEPEVDPANWTSVRISDEAGRHFDQVHLADLDDDGDLDIVTCERLKDLGVIWYENPLR